MTRSSLTSALTALLVVAVTVLVIGQAVGQPVLLGFVTSDSMEPTLEPGDAFVVVPEPIAGDVEEGDVVVFESETIDGDEYTTHRVVGETDSGYVTKGDANPFTDQDGGEPPVGRDRVAATALQIDGNVVAIPLLGTLVVGVRRVVLAAATAVLASVGLRGLVDASTVGFVLFGMGAALFALSRTSEDRRRDRSRRRESVVDGRRVVLAVLALVFLPANAVMIPPSGVDQITVEGDAVGDGIATGERIEGEFGAENDGLVTMLIVLETEGDATIVAPSELVLLPGRSTTATLSLPAPPPGGTRTVTLAEHRYVLLLPPSVLLALHDVHPVLAWGVINLLLAAAAVGLVGAVFGLGRVRFRNRSRPITLSRRFRELFR